MDKILGNAPYRHVDTQLYRARGLTNQHATTFTSFSSAHRQTGGILKQHATTFPSFGSAHQQAGGPQDQHAIAMSYQSSDSFSHMNGGQPLTHHHQQQHATAALFQNSNSRQQAATDQQLALQALLQFEQQHHQRQSILDQLRLQQQQQSAALQYGPMHSTTASAFAAGHALALRQHQRQHPLITQQQHHQQDDHLQPRHPQLHGVQGNPLQGNLAAPTLPPHFSEAVSFGSFFAASTVFPGTNSSYGKGIPSPGHGSAFTPPAILANRPDDYALQVPGVASGGAC